MVVACVVETTGIITADDADYCFVELLAIPVDLDAVTCLAELTEVEPALAVSRPDLGAFAPEFP